jgi:hypothetical protein
VKIWSKVMPIEEFLCGCIHHVEREMLDGEQVRESFMEREHRIGALGVDMVEA